MIRDGIKVCCVALLDENHQLIDFQPLQAGVININEGTKIEKWSFEIKIHTKRFQEN